MAYICLLRFNFYHAFNGCVWTKDGSASRTRPMKANLVASVLNEMTNNMKYFYVYFPSTSLLLYISPSQRSLEFSSTLKLGNPFNQMLLVDDNQYSRRF
ncbi:CLUMA_CG004078, isoform A [Clunio marinus]|uniref:CLUMA_CG004078, isoform A n=1 Tax=Clunio marinus TaxID=568069 RepID=A0A1J1HQJ6_9DIPT|nr:CLUMA_CG004078, isoform A [Clunio marinus]